MKAQFGVGAKPLVIPDDKLAQPQAPRVAQAEWTAANGRVVTMALNNRAAMCLEDITSISFFAFCFSPRPGFSWLAVLAYSACASWRRENSHKHYACGSWQREPSLDKLTLDQWIDGDWLPHYFSPQWQELGELLKGLIDQTFPDAAEHRAILASVTAAIQKTSSGNGIDSGPQSDPQSPDLETESANSPS